MLCGALCYSGGILFRTFGNGVGRHRFAIGSVLAAEAFNTAIEALCDFASPAYQEAIKHTKDLAAGAVLIVAIAAAVVGLLIFIPKIMALC